MNHEPTSPGPPPPPQPTVPYYGPAPAAYGWFPSPAEAAAAQAAQAARDASNLRTLVICHYVAAGLVALIGCIFIFHVFLGATMVREAAAAGAKGQAGPPQAFGYAFMAFGAVAVLLHWAAAVGGVCSARYISRRRHRTFSLVIAGILCLNMPIGTALGVFTFILLGKESVQAEYERARATAGR